MYFTDSWTILQALVSFTSDDGELSYKEFVKVMKSRTTRGLEKVGVEKYLPVYVC